MKQSKCYYVIILLLLSILFRIPEIVRNPYAVSYDSRAYYNLAVNVIKGNGYTANIKPPYEPYFWREPIYPLFLASFLVIPSVFGYKPSYMKEHNTIDPIELIGKSHTEPMWEKLYLKIIQLLLDSVSILIIYSIIKNFYPHNKAFIICVLTSFFTSFIGLYTLLLRETPQLFLMIALSLLLYKYDNNNNYSTIIFIGILLGLLSLTLQLNILLIPILVIFIILSKMNKKIIAKHILLIFLTSGLIISPWVIRSYVYTKDWHVIKTMGSNLTVEQLNFGQALARAKKAGALDNHSEKEFDYKYVHNLSQKDQFQNAYSGKYAQLSDSLNKLCSEYNKDKDKNISNKIKKFANRFLFLFVPRIYYTRLYSGFKTFLFAFVAIIGLVPSVKLFKKYKFIWPLLIFHISFFFSFGDESRRLVYMHYFWATMAAIGIIEIYNYIKNNPTSKSLVN